jgi:hypothetical protein
VNRRPDFDELVDEIEDPEERARLARVHELLVEAGPPPELSPTLQAPPPASPRDFPWQRPRRIRPRAVLVAAAVITAFFIGYLSAGPGGDQEALPKYTRTINLEGKGDARGAIGVGVRDERGNWPMVLSVWGLEHLSGGDYYELALTRKGKPVVTCGTFNVSGDQTTIRLTAAYNLKGFDGWVVLRYDAETHDDVPVLSAASV